MPSAILSNQYQIKHLVIYLQRVLARLFFKLKYINTAEPEKINRRSKNNYRVKPLLKNQLRKLLLIKGVLEDSKELIA